MMFPKHSILDLWPGSEDAYLSISSNLLAEWPRAMYCMIHIQNPAYYRKFRHSQAYSCLTKTYLESCVTLAIQNPAIFRILACLESKTYSELKHILAYSERCVTLAYREPCHIQNFAIFRILADLGPKVYSECCLYEHIQAYSGIFDNGSCNINFLFFVL